MRRCQLEPRVGNNNWEACVTSLARESAIVKRDIHSIFIIPPSHVANFDPPLSLCLLPRPPQMFNHLNSLFDKHNHLQTGGLASSCLFFSPCGLCVACQRRNGVVLDTASISRLSHKRLMATFQVEAQRGEQDLYRCITLSSRGATVSNFGELIVRGMLDLATCRLLNTHTHTHILHPLQQVNKYTGVHTPCPA